MNISGKASVFDLTEIPNTNWYFGIVVDEAVAYQSVSRMVTSALLQGLLHHPHRGGLLLRGHQPLLAP